MDNLRTFSYDGKCSNHIEKIRKKRKVIAPFNNNSIDNTYDGETFISTRKGSLLIYVDIALTQVRGQENRDRQRSDLAEFFNKTKPVPLIFDSEDDRVYYVLPEGDIEYDDSMGNTCNIIFKVFDGLAHARYSRITETSIGPDGMLKALVRNRGTASVPFNVLVKHGHENAYFGVTSSYGVIQVGDSDETDKGVLPSKVLVDVKAKDGTFQNLTTGGGTFTQNFGTDGNWRKYDIGNRSFLAPNSFGTNVSTWHGATKRGNLTDSNGDGLTNFTVDLRVFFLNSNAKQKGLMQFLMVNGDGTKKVGFSLDKGLAGNKAKIRLYTGEKEAHIDIDTGANNYVDYDHGQIRIDKVGNKLTFSFANRKVSYVVNSIKDTRFTSYNLLSAKMGTTEAMARLWWERLQIIKHYTDKTADIPNRFPENSELFLDGETTNVYLNGVRTYDANGSEWFELPPGDTELEFYYSDFAGTPEITVEHREAWL
ncbi:distal tail protein Dit [Enterococcus sp. AZ150]|uniref:distal tail protein Dit n=1 Tax=Enterococcus sp. AZ150 TaxID=2774866 RepID=UPI003F699E8D